MDLTRLDAALLDDRDSLARTLFDAVDQPVALLDAAGTDVRFVTANRAWFQLLRRDRNRVVGRTPHDLFPQRIADVITERCAEVLGTGIERLDTDVLDLPGGPVTIETKLVPLPSTTGRSRILAVQRDRSQEARIEADLDSSRAQLSALAGAFITGVFTTDLEGRCTDANGRLLEILGLGREEALGTGWFRAVHPEDRPTVLEFAEAARVRGMGGPIRVRARHTNGTIRWVEARCAAIRTGDGEVTGFVGTVDDISHAVIAEETSTRLTTLLEATPDLVGIAGPDGRFVWMNAAARRLHGFGADADVSSVHVFDLYPPESRRLFRDEVIPALESDGLWSGELRLRRPDDTPVPVHQSILAHHGPDGAIAYYSSIGRDLSERRALEAELTHRALHDPLTALPNRALFMDRLDQALARSVRTGNRLAVLSVDVDRFQLVNDSLGHDAGDRLLLEVARRVRGALRPSDTVARLGADEFVVLCEDVPGHGVPVAQRIREAVSAAFVVEEGEIYLSVSVGIACPDDPRAVTAEDLVRDAAAALRQAKDHGRDRHELFDEHMRGEASRLVRTERALRRAIEEDALEVHFQPVVHLARGEILGFEALARWLPADADPIPPDEFIPVAEEMGLIASLGDAILGRACEHVAAWGHGDRTPRLWVNLSARQLGRVTLVDSLASVLDRTGIPADRVEVEITESVLMDESEATAETMRQLRGLGVGLAIDDFGTGYSSLGYLKRFPVSTLKIDRSFVDGLGRKPEDTAIVTAQIGMAHALGLQVIAEGVESAEQLHHLRELGCDLAQGYLFAPPLVAPDAQALFAASPRW